MMQPPPRNPFQYLLPVAPNAFVGRWPLVHQLALDLTLDGGDSHALIAGRRCGKSSLLTALAHTLRQPPTPTTAGDWLTIPVLFDFKAAQFTSVGAFFAHILTEARRRVDATTRRRPPDAWPTPVTLPADWFQQLASQPTLTLRDFEDALGYLLDQLDASPLSHDSTTTLSTNQQLPPSFGEGWGGVAGAGGVTLSSTNQQLPPSFGEGRGEVEGWGGATPIRLLLLLDEVDEVLDEPWLSDLFNQLRALVYSGDLKSRVRLVLAGSRRFLDQVSDRGSPLWNVLKLHYLELFDPTGFAELSARAPALPAAIAHAVWQQSGGHPFLAQYLLHHLWEPSTQPTNAAPQTIDQVHHLAQRFQTEQITDLQGWVNGIEAVGLRTYQALARHPDWLSEQQLFATIAAPALAVKRSLIALCYHGLARHQHWTHYQCAGDLFRTWATRYAAPDADPPPAPPPERTPEQPPVVVNVNVATNTGSGAIAQGEGATAAGERGVAVQGNVQDSAIVTGDSNNLQPATQTGVEPGLSQH